MCYLVDTLPTLVGDPCCTIVPSSSRYIKHRGMLQRVSAGRRGWREREEGALYLECPPSPLQASNIIPFSIQQIHLCETLSFPTPRRVLPANNGLSCVVTTQHTASLSLSLSSCIFLWEEKEKKGNSRDVLSLPNQQRTLNKLLTELRCRNFVNRHRLSLQICIKRAKTCMQCVTYSD